MILKRKRINIEVMRVWDPNPSFYEVNFTASLDNMPLD